MAVRRFAVAVVAATMPLAGLASRAYAYNADVFVISGSGYMTPSPGVIPTGQNIYLNAAATVAGTDGVLAVYPCSFSGTSIESLAGGTGAVSGYCGPVYVPYCDYARTGAVMTLVCHSSDTNELTFTAIWSPVDVFPTTQFTFLGAGEVVSVTVS